MRNNNIYKTKHIGEINIATNKQLMVITEYNTNDDITIQFEDSTIVKHKRYKNFTKTNIRNPKTNRIGTTVTAQNGMEMTIIAYRSSVDIDVQFEDGTTVNHKTYKHFIEGKIGNPNNPTDKYQNKFKKQAESRIGITVTAKNGMEMTIIAYRRSEDIDVKFEDGTIVKHKAYKHFIEGKIGNPNISKEQVITGHKRDEHIGETMIHNASGMKITIINYKNSNDIDVQFEDGTILCHQKYSAVKCGKIRHPKYNVEQFATNRNIGQQIITENNVLAVVASYENWNNITVIFENGIKMKTQNVSNIQNRKTVPNYIDDIHLDEFAFFYDGEYYYICSSSKWNNNRKILSINQIYEIARNEMK